MMIYYQINFIDVTQNKKLQICLKGFYSLYNIQSSDPKFKNKHHKKPLSSDIADRVPWSAQLWTPHYQKFLLHIDYCGPEYQTNK